MIQRFSSRKDSLGNQFFRDALSEARSYDRIAGYFSSSILEISGEAIDKMEGTVRIVCNSHLQAEDVKFIKDAPQAMKLEWCDGKPEEKLSEIPERLAKLYNYLVKGKLRVRVLPNDVFGLIHGKAGIITTKDDNKVAFMGSMNETFSGWGKGGNYEIAWIDNDDDAISWVQEEFDALWEHPLARPLSDFIIDDIKRIAERKIIYDIEEWRDSNSPASSIIESPVYRKEFGLWEHQKYFINKAYLAHKESLGARFVLADMVGLGKTVQLALSAMLMALDGNKPILIIVPKTLIWQWQDELSTLLDMPSAVWNGKCWVDENKLEYPVNGDTVLNKCPRRIGIISQGLIVRSKQKISEILLNMNYECVIVDEAHRARRKNAGYGRENEAPQPNNLMAFLLEISLNTKSMLLATATPVQIHPIEAWDLLFILSQGNSFILGDDLSKWQREPNKGLNLITLREELDEENQMWDWLRNPFPPSSENPITFGVFRRQIGLEDNKFIVTGDKFYLLNLREKATFRRIISDNFFRNYNPFIRYIIRRERKYLETTINPQTNLPYIKPIKVILYGENYDESISLSTYLSDAYQLAEDFSRMLGQRIKGSGFIKTMLLRRVCSSIFAGLSTAKGILNNWLSESEDDEDDSSTEWKGEADESTAAFTESTPFKYLTNEEKEILQRFIKILEFNKDEDPKYDLLKKIIMSSFINEPWIERGCIVFSQYFDTIKWICGRFALDYPEVVFGLYAGSDKSGIYEDGVYHRKSKEEIKLLVRNKRLKLIFGTDAASEGLNLQSLGSLINLDLPWNPTRLEQRKGRIQRIGQERDEIWIYNMRYKDSVEDRVHQLLANRLKSINELFGQIPDTLEDVWVEIALNNLEEAEKRIKELSESEIHPFYNRYQDQNNISPINWEQCSLVLDSHEKRKILEKAW